MNGNTQDFLIALRDIAACTKTGVHFGFIMLYFMVMNIFYLYNINRALQKIAGNESKK